ncbi:MAG: PH domain-containing protein [Candidatus Aenigmarchaeota archaeon]|nr:PH domain-containing protein [Candidatus Aenigmarchaeota archaeon]MDW8149745.1 PH domain-containing protein [Candidatus Aenigmarchaeota archaeon]
MIEIRTSRIKNLHKYLIGFAFLIFGLLNYFKLFIFYLVFPFSNFIYLSNVAIGFLIVLYTEVKRMNTRYIIKENEITEVKGLIIRKRTNVLLSRVSHIKLKQNLIDRIFGVGDIEIFVEDETPEMIIVGAKKAKDVLRYIESRIGQKEKKEIEKISYIEEKRTSYENVEKLIKNRFKNSGIIKFIATKFFDIERKWKSLVYVDDVYYLIELDEKGKIVSEIRLRSEEVDKIKDKFL